jgi:hypothetical protein
MKLELTKIAALVASSALLAGTAAADLIAGWDFSQYAVGGALDDGSGPIDSLPANYSALDTTFNAGGTDSGDSADFGTFHIDGSFGSTNVDETSGTPSVAPYATRTRANRRAPALGFGAPAGLERNDFDSFNVLRGEGQAFRNHMGLTARGSGQHLTFRTHTGAPITGTGLEVSLAGRALQPTGNVDVEVRFAADCSGFTLIDTLTLSEDDEQYNVLLSPSITEADGEVCVRLTLDDTNGQPVIDNVAIVPEPGQIAMLGAGVLWLAGLRLRRRA